MTGSGPETPIPPELEEAFVDAPEARAAFDLLSPSHQREHAQYVADAVKAETRRRRAAKTVESLQGD